MAFRYSCFVRNLLRIQHNSLSTRALLPTSQHCFPVKSITPNDSVVSYTVINQKGDVTTVSKKIPKWTFLRDHGLYPRDLRRIDSTTVDVVPSIVMKSSCILINLLHIKAMIQRDKVYVFDSSQAESATKLGVLMYDLESKLSQSVGNHLASQYYEHRVLESILIHIMVCLETEYKQHYSICGMILNDLEDEIDRDKLQDLLIKSKNLTSFYQKASLIRDVLDELLESDDDLAGMYLTEKKFENDDFADLEMLLETYYKQCDEYVQQSESLIQDIKSTEEIVNIILDANRNSLMLFELKVTIYTLGFTVATIIPAFYGMNLKNFIEESVWGFACVCIFSVASAIAVTTSNFRALRGVTKLTMMSNHPISPVSRNIINAQFKTDKELRTIWNNWKNGLKIIWFGKEKAVGDVKDRDMVWRWLMDENKNVK